MIGGRESEGGCECLMIPQAMAQYKKVYEFFSKGLEGPTWKKAGQYQKTLQSSICCGWLLYNLTELHDKMEMRKACKEQLAVADKHALQLPLALKDRARLAVLMNLPP